MELISTQLKTKALAVMATFVAMLTAMWASMFPTRKPEQRRELPFPVPAGGAHRLTENFAVVYGLKPADHQSAGADTESVHMGKLFRAALVFQFGTLTGNAVLTVHSGATAGTKTTALPFRYRLSQADQGDAGADQYGDWTDVAATGLTLTAATYDNRIIVVEVDSDELPEGEPWLTANLSDAASALNAACVIVGEPRNEANKVPTVI